jgi:hypothetical protein
MVDFNGVRHTNATFESNTESVSKLKICLKYSDGQVSEPGDIKKE